MAQDKDKIKDLFSSKLNGYEAKPPMLVWDELGKQLDAKATHGSPLKVVKAAAKTKIITIAASVAAIAASVALVFHLLPTDLDKTPSKITEVVEPDKPSEENKDITIKDLSETIAKEQIAKDKSILAHSANTRSATTQSSRKSTPQAMEKSSLMAKADALVNAEDDNKDRTIISIADVKGVDDDCEQEEDYITNPNVRNKEAVTEIVFEEETKPKKKKGIGLAFSTDMTMLGSDSKLNGGGDLLFSRTDRTDSFLDAFDIFDDNVELEHRQPIRVGVLVSKDINSKFAIETGIVYTHLSSKSRSSDIFGMRESQKFDYLGIPINVNYTFVTWGKARFYVSGGVMFQKDINGSYTSSTNLSSLLNGSSENEIDIRTRYFSAVFDEMKHVKRNIHQSNIQVSFHGVGGVSYPIYRALNVYGNVGVGHYIKAGNKYHTIYSDRKTHLDVNLGLKFSF